MTNNTPQRLVSLDILRGFDLFLLVFLQPVALALGRQLGLPWTDAILYQLDHEVWAGFRFWDLVMPLFLFMTGASMPFSFAKFKSAPKADVYRKVLKRFALLFLFGMIVQGNLLSLNPDYFQYYNNTLQAIASGYLIAAVLLLHTSVRTQVIATAALLFIYWIPMTFCGDFTPEGNFANRVDALVMGNHRGDPTYTWIWSTLTFGVTVMLGTFAGRLMKNGSGNRNKTALKLLAIGVALTAAGLLWGLQMPIIKRVWTCSMTLFSGGLCFLLMAAFYYWVDCLGRHRGLDWLKIYGMNSITAYLIGEVVSFRSVAHSVLCGTEQYVGDYYPALLTFANFLILFFILKWMYRHGVFLKI